MIKDLMVHLDGSGEDETRLAHAEALSIKFSGARLTGLYTNGLPEYAYALGASSEFADMSPIFELEEDLKAQATEKVAKLRTRMSGAGTITEVRRIDAWPRLIPELAASQARVADLFVATSPYDDQGNREWHGLVEGVLFGAGHPLYLVPPGCLVRSAPRSILIAWKDTLEAARALSEALPFLKEAKLVRLLMAETELGTPGPEAAADVASHLDRHGVSVEIKSVKTDNNRVGAAILEQAAQMSADLIVIGAYGHSRLREFILGGVTREVLARSSIPLLVAR